MRSDCLDLCLTRVVLLYKWIGCDLVGGMRVRPYSRVKSCVIHSLLSAAPFSLTVVPSIHEVFTDQICSPECFPPLSLRTILVDVVEGAFVW